MSFSYQSYQICNVDCIVPLNTEFKFDAVLDRKPEAVLLCYSYVIPRPASVQSQDELQRSLLVVMVRS